MLNVEKQKMRFIGHLLRGSRIMENQISTGTTYSKCTKNLWTMDIAYVVELFSGSSKNYQEILDNLKSCLNILICSKTEVVRIILRLSCLVCGVKLCRFIVHAKLEEGPCSSEQVLIKGRSSFITWNPLQRSAPLE